MFFSTIIFEILLNQRVNTFIFVFVKKRIEVNINIFVVSFYNNETKFFNTILTVCTKARTLRQSRV